MDDSETPQMVVVFRFASLRESRFLVGFGSFVLLEVLK